LSGGNQQKVIVGKFLLTGAKILLFYDLTRGVDVGTKAEIFKMMEQLATEGYAVLFFSTDLAELVNVPHRTCVMFDGRIVAEFARGSVTQEGATQEEIARAEVTQEKLVAAMVGGTSRADGEVSPVPGEPAEPGGEP
jgi:ribose transport system ATP-binding protein